MADTDLRVTKRSGDEDQKVLLQANEQKDLMVSQGMPPYTELVRKGQRWSTMSTAAVAGLVVRPSTVAAFEIFNPPTNTKSLIVDRLFYFNLVSTNVIESFSGWAQVTTPNRVAAAPTSGSFAIRGSSGSAYGGAVIAAAGTTVVASGWFPWTQAVTKGAGGVVPHGCAVAEVEGRLIVPPGASLCLHVVSSLVGQTFTQGASWYEQVLTIE
jgi:hypothetical protein